METHQHEPAKMRSRSIQPKKTRYTLLLFILSTALSLHFLKVPYFSKGFSLLPPVRANDGDLFPTREETRINLRTALPWRGRDSVSGVVSLYIAIPVTEDIGFIRRIGFSRNR